MTMLIVPKRSTGGSSEAMYRQLYAVAKELDQKKLDDEIEKVRHWSKSSEPEIVSVMDYFQWVSTHLCRMKK